MKECANCGFLNDNGCCECPHADKWYACPIENKKPENIEALKEFRKEKEELEELKITRKEAAHIVDVAFGIPLAVRRIGEDKTYLEAEVKEAKRMAIEALEQKSCTVKDSENYEALWIRLYNWLNDMRFSIAPDETVTDDHERKVRSIQVDLLDEIMEWMVDQVPKADGGGE